MSLPQAVPQTPAPPVPTPERDYEVLTRNCAWGKQGEVIKLTLTDNQELSLLQAGTVKRAAPPKPVEAPRPTPPVRPTLAVKEGKRHG